MIYELVTRIPDITDDKVDQVIAKLLTNKPQHHLTEEEMVIARKLVKKYQQELGVDYQSIPYDPVPEPEVNLVRGTISVNRANRFQIQFDYDYFLIQIIKKHRGARYNEFDKAWTLPINTKTKHFVYKLAKIDKFCYNQSVRPHIEEVDLVYVRIDTDRYGGLIDALNDYLDHENDEFLSYAEYRMNLIKALEDVVYRRV